VFVVRMKEELCRTDQSRGVMTMSTSTSVPQHSQLIPTRMYTYLYCFHYN
jgi:hypothetical protein